jgi:superfamily II DNA or RNA helicase
MSPDRKETLEWFDNAGPGSVLCNAMLLTEGWDCPSVDCVVVLRPTKIRSLYAQMVGRGTRLSPGKENLLILDFLWLCKKHNLCKPANLTTDNVADIETVTRATEEEEIDLFDAVSDAEEQRKSALAAELARQQKKKSKLLNPLDVFTFLEDIELLDYEPIFAWETAEASEAQVKALENFGLDAEGVTKGYACKMLDKMIKRANEGKATIRQINALRKHGYDPVDWSFDQASKKLSQLAAVGWQRWRLHE